MRLAIIMGTRPELIKMSPIVRECKRANLDYFIIHTGQHYSYNMDGVFFRDLDLPKPRYNLGVGSGTYADEVSKALIGIDGVLEEEKPSVVLVYGDTNSCIAGALSAKKHGITVGHVEAGLRSYFSGMPEEINRVIVDHCSDYLFAPTEKSKTILLSEGIPKDRVFVTGNTIVDAIHQGLDALKNGCVCRFAKKRFVLATVHRQENVDDSARLSSILDGLEKVANELGMPVVYPMHPRAKKMMKQLGRGLDGVWLLEPLGYLQFLCMERDAKLILTDSGGLQEEACILGVPCVTLRDNTERPETIEVGSNVLAGTSPERIAECAKMMLGRDNSWANPFGDGRAAERIVAIVKERCAKRGVSL